MIKMKRTVFFVIVLFASLADSCIDEAPLFTVPQAPVNFKIDLKGYDHDLNGALSCKTVTEKDVRTPHDRVGYSGLLLVRDHQASGLYAYDLCCPHEDKKEIVVIPSSDGKAVCPHCGTVFVTMFGMGTVESGPSREPLQRYGVTSLGNDVFLIGNPVK